MPIEDFVYAGESFTDVFSAEQQATLRDAFPTGVCDYSKPGNGFQAAVTWLRYQDAAGATVFGGEPMGAPPVSVYFAPVGGSAPVDARTTPILPATGGGAPFALVAALLLGGFVVTRHAVHAPGRAHQRSGPGG